MSVPYLDWVGDKGGLRVVKAAGALAKLPAWVGDNRVGGLAGMPAWFGEKGGVRVDGFSCLWSSRLLRPSCQKLSGPLSLP